MEVYLICLVVGFALGFRVREAIRGGGVRGYAVKGTPNTDHEFLKVEASEDERRHYINRCCASFQS
jgi:hypothetical protein